MKNTKILYYIALFVLLLGFLLWPSNKKVEQAQTKLDSTNESINKYREEATNSSFTNSDFDLQQAEQQAQHQITDGVSLALGGIHSEADFKQNKAKLEQELGNKLMTNLISYSKDRDTNQFITPKNDNVTVGFSNVNNPSNVDVNISTEFERQDGTKKYVLIEGRYNLKAGKFINTSINYLAKQPTTYSTQGGNN